jgi:hypothetical protein
VRQAGFPPAPKLEEEEKEKKRRKKEERRTVCRRAPRDKFKNLPL